MNIFTKWEIEKYDSNRKLYETLKVDNNLILKQGLEWLFQCLWGETLGDLIVKVGDSQIPVDWLDTDLKGTNTAYGNFIYQTYYTSQYGPDGWIVVISEFLNGIAIFDWNEIGISSSNTLINRKVYPIGTKKIGDIWRVRALLWFKCS